MNIAMKVETLLATRPEPTVLIDQVTPSMRIPVTLENRALLRLLRSAEIAAWEKKGSVWPFQASIVFGERDLRTMPLACR